MRPTSSRFVTPWITALCLLAVFFALDGMTPAQATRSPKRQLSKQSLASVQPPTASARMEKSKTPPPLTADSWTGTAGDNNWGTATNWSAGVPTSADAVTIGTASAGVNMNVSTGMFGTLTLSNSADALTINNGEVLQAFGNISNNGALTLNSSGNFTELVLEGNVTLSGTGTLTLSNNANNFIFGANALDQFTNQQTIQGAGDIGNGTMALVNSGTINANQSGGMTINPNDGFTNTGTVEATGAKLTLSGSTTINNAGGTISSNGGGTVVLETSVNGGTVTVNGASTLQLSNGSVCCGTLTNSSTGTIEILAGSNGLGGTINNSAGGLLKVDNGAFLYLQPGTYSQLGTEKLISSAIFTELVLEGNVTLSGGTVTLSNNVNNYIFGQAGTDTLTNNETISGAGHIGNAQMALVNSGTINSNQSAGLTIDANFGVTNTGTLEATSGAALAITSSAVNNAGGTISANTGTIQLNSSTINGGAITLTGASTLQLNTSTIHGGDTITNSSAGTIEIATGTNALGGTINNSAGGTFKIDNGAFLNLDAGTYAQLGTVQLNSSGNFTELVLEGNVTLSGGSVTLSNNVNNYIFGQAGTDTLTNQETISGAGHIGNAQMALVNSGTINSNQSAGLTIDANFGVTNTGTLEATSGAVLAITSSPVNNTGGTISANTGTIQVNSSTINGGVITLTGASALQLNTSTIHGGETITNSSSGTIEIATGTNALGGTINNSAGGTFKIDNGAFLDLDGGTYSQLGTMQMNSSGNLTELIIEGNTTLNGETLTMSANANNFILAANTFDILTNAGTIQGAGNIGNGGMGLMNSGTIIANASGNLLINVDSQNFNNTGTVEASGATLTIEGPGVTFLTNDNQSTGTLSGGTYIANGSNIQWNAGPNNITTLAAHVTEEGGGELFNTCTGTGCNSNMLAGLTSITSAGGLTIGGLAFTDAGSFSNAGSLTLLSGESFTVGSLAQISGGSLTAGTYVLDANLNLSGTAQTITTNAATLTLAGGTIENTSNSTNALAGLATNSGKLTIGGSSNNVSTTAASFSNTGTLTINGGDSFTAAKLTQISGTTLSAGTYVLGGNLDLTTAGISIATNSATLTLQGGTINSNGVNALSGLKSNTKSLTLANNANLTTSATSNFTDTGTVTVNAGSTLTVGGAGHNYSQTAGTTTVDGTLVGTSITATGGSIFGAGALNGNVSIGNATGAAATLNVGDSGKAGLLAITGNYTQLATGVMKVSIGGLTTGTYSELTVSGTATLGGTLTVAIVNGLVLTASNIGTTFTVLSSTGTLSGTFTNSTVTVGTDVFSVSYVGNTVVLTLTSVTGAKGTTNGIPAAMAVAKPRLAPGFHNNIAGLSGGLRHGVGAPSRPIMVAGLAPAKVRTGVGSTTSDLRVWEHVPVTTVRPVAVAQSSSVNGNSFRAEAPSSNLRMGQSQAIGIRTPLAGWMGTSINQRVPVRVMPPMMLPHVAR